MSKKCDCYTYGISKRPTYYDFKNKQRCVQNYVYYMLNRTLTMFEYDNLPETIPKIYLERFLQQNGEVCIAEHENNLYCFIAGLGGFPDVYYEPTEMIVANPALDLSKSYKIGVDCVRFRNDSYSMGLLPICNKYASLMVENDITMRQVTINKRIPFIASVHGDNQKCALDLYFKRIEDGESQIAVSDSFDETLKTTPYSTTDNELATLIEYHQYIKGSWFSSLGVKSQFTMKRAYVNEAESSMSDDTLIPLIDDMFTCRKKAVEEINKMFNTNIVVRKNSIWEEIDTTRELNIENIESNIESNSLDSKGGETDVSERIDESENDTPE